MLQPTPNTPAGGRSVTLTRTREPAPEYDQFGPDGWLREQPPPRGRSEESRATVRPTAATSDSPSQRRVHLAGNANHQRATTRWASEATDRDRTPTPDPPPKDRHLYFDRTGFNPQPLTRSRSPSGRAAWRPPRGGIRSSETVTSRDANGNSWERPRAVRLVASPRTEHAPDARNVHVVPSAQAADAASVEGTADEGAKSKRRPRPRAPKHKADDNDVSLAGHAPRMKRCKHGAHWKDPSAPGPALLVLGSPAPCAPKAHSAPWKCVKCHNLHSNTDADWSCKKCGKDRRT